MVFMYVFNLNPFKVKHSVHLQCSGAHVRIDEDAASRGERTIEVEYPDGRIMRLDGEQEDAAVILAVFYERYRLPLPLLYPKHIRKDEGRWELLWEARARARGTLTSYYLFILYPNTRVKAVLGNAQRCWEWDGHKMTVRDV